MKRGSGARGILPSHIEGQEGVVQRVVCANGAISYFDVRYGDAVYGVFPDEIEEITEEPREETTVGYCDACCEMLTPHKKEETCKHIVYVCCDCKSGLRRSCAACQARLTSYYTWNRNWNDDLNYD